MEPSQNSVSPSMSYLCGRQSTSQSVVSKQACNVGQVSSNHLLTAFNVPGSPFTGGTWHAWRCTRLWYDLPMGTKGRRAVCILNVGIQQVFPSLVGQLTYWVPLGNVLSKVTWLVPRYEESTGVRHQEFGYGCVGNVTGHSQVSGQGWCKQLLLWHVRSPVVNNISSLTAAVQYLRSKLFFCTSALIVVLWKDFSQQNSAVLQSRKYSVFQNNFKPLLEYTPKQCSPATLTASWISSFLGVNYLCDYCYKGYSSNASHSCSALCCVCRWQAWGGSDLNLSYTPVLWKTQHPRAVLKQINGLTCATPTKKCPKCTIKHMQQMASKKCQKKYAVSRLQRVSQIFCYMPLLRRERQYNFHLWFWNLHWQCQTAQSLLCVHGNCRGGEIGFMGVRLYLNVL